MCEEDIISMYSSEKPHKIYCNSCWYSDKWDPMEYGKNYNFNKSFFEQFKELELKVPNPALYQENCVNSPWINREHDSKNCYLNFGGIQNEECAYNTYALYSKDVFDNHIILKSEFCCENFFCRNCYKTFFSQFCFNCQEVYFSFNCRNCFNLVGCVNLRNKSYHIFNNPVSREEYKKFIEKNLLDQKTNQFIKEKLKEIKISMSYKFAFSANAVDCTGDFLEESKNCKFCFYI